MKSYFLVLIVAFGLVSCGNKKEVTPETPATATLGEATQAPQAASNIKDLKTLVGKYPKDVQLFEKYNLSSRIEKLLGSGYADFKATWSEESPMKMDEEIIYFSGCKAGACKEDKYFIVLDLIENNLNIIHFKDKRARSYEEGSVIGMPSKIADEFEKIRKDQGY